MTEQEQVKKRGWVKNAAIIFLALMLVLTLFSNTIMNRSLPEVAVKYAEPGTINAKVRGTGTVEANQSYEVVLQQTRTVGSVAVKVGDQVSTGDLLFTLADTESGELEAARSALDDMTLAYRLALIDASSSDYAKDNRAIQQLRDKLKAAQDTCSQNAVSESDLSLEKSRITALEAKIEALKEELAEAGSGVAENKTELENQLDQKERDLRAAELAYKDKLKQLKDDAKEQRDDDIAKATPEERKRIPSLEIYEAALAIEYGKYDPDSEEFSVATAYVEVTRLEGEVAALETALDNDTSDRYNRLNEELKANQAELTQAQASLETLQARREKWESANEEAETLQNQLDESIFALAEQQKEDNKNQQKEALNLADQRKKIADQQKKVNELSADATGSTVVAQASGVVKSINVTAGNNTVPGEPMAVIEVQDMGYSLSFSVTAEQAKKVKVGDTAEVSNYYWGPSITAKLTAIKNDPENPGQKKLLVFRLDGEDLSAGSQLTIALGEKSANFDTIVPNSALRSDNKGDFVLVVIAKSTPLGNRYYANRVDVTVLATDDVNSAVSGGLASYDYVVTTSNKPIEPGKMVRLVEE